MAVEERAVGRANDSVAMRADDRRLHDKEIERKCFGKS